MRTQVGIVGGGPAGLLLARLLGLAGIDCIVLERRTPEYLRARIRAGLLEQGTVDMLTEAGVGDRLARERLIHDGRGAGLRRQAPSHRPEGAVGQGGHHLRPGRDPEGPDGRPRRAWARRSSTRPRTSACTASPATSRDCAITRTAAAHEIECDFIAGCDGFHGVSRQAIPQEVIRIYERVYPFGWLGMLSDTPPVNHELIYTNHERGFALCTMRSMTRSRYYLQVSGRRRRGRLVRRPVLDRAEAAHPAGCRRRAADRPVDREERGAVALVRGRADAPRPPVPCRRRRAHRAAHRRQGPQPRRRRRALPGRGAGRLLQDPAARSCWTATPTAASRACGRRSASPGG